jgi:hypothetical protein
MYRNVEAVDPALLIEAHQIVAERRGTNGSSLILVGHFHDRLEPDAILALQYRMVALANVVKHDTGSPWIVSVKGKDYRLIDNAMFRAAATTPLSINDDQVVATLAFDRDAFIRNALAESEPDGNA